MTDLRKRVENATNFIKSKTKVKPRVAIILGTGLGALADEIRNKEVISYSQIPGFPISTVIGHAGQLILGTIGKKSVVAMQGRFHRYEGYSLEEVAFPVRVMKRLGAEILIISNAAGGMNPLFEAGDLMIITDHINLMGDSPLIGVNDEKLGPRFPDMSQPYDRKLVALAEEVAREEKIKVQKGVYVAVTGPNLETAAEYRLPPSINLMCRCPCLGSTCPRYSPRPSWTIKLDPSTFKYTLSPATILASISRGAKR